MLHKTLIKRSRRLVCLISFKAFRHSIRQVIGGRRGEVSWAAQSFSSHSIGADRLCFLGSSKKVCYGPLFSIHGTPAIACEPDLTSPLFQVIIATTPKDTKERVIDKSCPTRCSSHPLFPHTHRQAAGAARLL